MMLAVRREFLSYTSAERLFILCAMLCGFLISADYAIIRPVGNAVFITAYGTPSLPYAWLAMVPVNLLVVGLYNKYLPRLGCFKMFLGIAGAIMLVNLFCAFFLKEILWLPFFFYVWKEVYVMLMFQQLWSVIHSTISLDRAKYLYGIFFGIGALGGVFGSVLPGFFAVQIGSESLLVATLPIFLLLALCYRSALNQTRAGLDQENNKSTFDALLHGMKLIANSRLLTFILLIVVFMQLAATLIDYQFNTVLEQTIAQKDLRTEYMGRIFGIMHIMTLCLQFLGSFFLIHFLGLKRSHFFIPLLLCLNSIAFLSFPLFGVISFSFIAIKCCDFSLFGVIKEMLYIPLQPDEKFRAKAVIDVFAYRSAKAFASLLILLLQFFAISPSLSLISWSCLFIFILWMLVVIRLYKPTVALTN